MEIVPGERVGSFVLGMGVNDALTLLRQQFVPQRPRVRVVYAPKHPLEKDIVLRVEDLGMQLRFEPTTQRLVMIDIFDITKLGLSYAGTHFGAHDVTRSKFLNLYKVFGPTYPGTLERNLGLYFLRYVGICLMFPIPMQFQHLFHNESKDLPLELPDGSSPPVQRLMIFSGNDERSPDLVTKPRGTDIPVLRPEITLTTLSSVYLEEVRFRIGDPTQGAPTQILFPQRSRKLEIGSSVQDVIYELGEPSRVYFKQDKRMQIHAIEDASSSKLASPLSANPATSSGSGVQKDSAAKDSSTGKSKKSKRGKGEAATSKPAGPDDSARRAQTSVANGKAERSLSSESSSTDERNSNYRPESPSLSGASATAARMQRDAEACFEPKDYFYNYFDLGIDILIDGKTHLVRKVIAHTNFPGHVGFSQYNKCDFRVIYSGSKQQQQQQAQQQQQQSRAGKREDVIVTPDMRFADIQTLLGPCGRPMIHDSGVAANPFGASYLYAYPGCVFEVMRSGYVAAITIF